MLLLGLGFSAAIGLWSHRGEQARLQTAFERRVETFALSLDSQVQSYLDTLPGLRLLDVLSDGASDLEFRRYVRAISLQQRFPGMALTFVARRVPDAEREAFEARVRADTSVQPQGHPDFAIRPPGQRPVYMVLRHQYPDNQGTLGYDLFDPAQTYRAAVEEAIDDGGYVATGPLLLARDRLKTNQPQLTTVVIRAAIYEDGNVPTDIAARRRAARGVVGISFAVTDIVRSMRPPELARHAMRIVDVRAEREGRPSLLFDGTWIGEPAAAAGASTFDIELPVANRRWRIEVTDGGDPVPVSPITALLAGFGVALSLSLAALTRSLVSARLRAEERIGEGLLALQIERDHLGRSEAMYRMLFENSLDAVLQTTEQGRVAAANPAACRLFGGDEARLRSTDSAALFDRDDGRVPALIAQRERHGHASGLCRMLRLDGTAFEAELATAAFADSDGQPAVSLVVRDVTERANLDAQRQRLAAILDATPDFVATADPSGRNMFLNRAARRLLGRGDDEDVSSVRVRDCHPAWATRLVINEGVPTALREGSWIGRSAIAAADGREIPVSQAIVCHRDAQGVPTHLSTIARDVSELEQAQAERQALELRMLEAQKQESIGTLAGGIAHDFNNVLAAILGNVAMARRDLPPAHATQAQLALIEQAATRARALVQQILTFSRRSAQVQAVVSLQAVVDEALALLRATLPATAHLQVQPSPTPLPVMGDATRLQQVVLNLCTNAWQALGERPGHIGVRLQAVSFADGEALPAGLAARRCARLQVSDDGDGMDEATRVRAFEPFFTTKPLGQGTGIGLAVVHGIVVASGGAIAVDSRPGEGTTVTVWLPLAAETETPPALPDDAPAAAEAPPPAPRSLHVLYVDDDEIMAITVAAMLRRAGHRVTTLDGGGAALQVVAEQPQAFDLVLTDHNMPGMSGLVLLERLQALEPALPVVITSGYVTEALQAQALAAGARAVLKKEFGVEQLAAAIEEILG